MILGIESSCDETSAAVVDGGRVRSLVIASQVDLHESFGGIVPEVAARAHVEQIVPVVSRALDEAEIPIDRIDAVAATGQPGLTGSLAVGFTFGKALAHGRGIPFVRVDHIEAHAFAARLTDPQLGAPYLVLLASGGHTLIAVAGEDGSLEVLGSTIDDACGEAFDKVGAFLGLAYPGGPALDRLAAAGDPFAFSFPVPRLNRDNAKLDFSYSGLKSAAIHQRERFHVAGRRSGPADVAASFQRAAVEQLIDRLGNAISVTGVRVVAAGGGVAANSELRRRLLALQAEGVLDSVVIPPIDLCVDNGAMVAGLGEAMLERGVVAPLDAGVSARVSGFRGGR